MGVRREFRKIALSTQETAPDTFFFHGTFFIPGSLGAQDDGNVVLLTAFGYSGVTGIIFALLRRFRELDRTRLALPGSHRWAGGGNSGRSHSRLRKRLLIPFPL